MEEYRKARHALWFSRKLEAGFPVRRDLPNVTWITARREQTTHADSSAEFVFEDVNMIEATIKLAQPSGSARQFIATSGSGHHLLMDDAMGNTAAKPIELVAIALAGCTAFDVINILRKKRQHVTDYEVRVEADQAPNPPQVFTEIRVHHALTGIDIAPKAVEDAIHLSEEKYCSVGAMLGRSARIFRTFAIRPANVEELAGASVS